MAHLPGCRPWPPFSYPIVSGDVPLPQWLPAATAETPAGGLTIVNADPSRIQHSYEYAVADELQIPGVANALCRATCACRLASGLDRKVVR